MAPVAVDQPSAELSAPLKAAGDKVATNSKLDLRNRPDFVLDYTQWEGPEATADSKAAFVRSLRSKVVGLGFFYLKNSPLEKKREDVFDLTERFFKLPLEQRMSIDIDNSRHFRGYSKFGDERTLSKVDHRDQVDYATAATPFPSECTSETPFLNLHGPNQFLPDSILPGHASLVQDWFSTCTALSNSLTSAIEQALGVSEGSLTAFLGNEENNTGKGPAKLKPLPNVNGEKPLPYARMKTIRYPVGEDVDGFKRTLEEEEGEGVSIGVHAHRDGGWLTILATSVVAGLQVQDLDGEWIDVPHLEGSVVINFGQQFEVVSQGLVNSATHRVLSNPQADRYSVAYFSMPALNSIMYPLDRSEFSPEVIKAYKEAEQARGGKGIVSDVTRNDLHAPGDPFGTIAWRGIYRSHPGVVNRWHEGVPA